MGTGDRHDAIDLTSDTDMEDYIILEASFFLNPTPTPVPSSSLFCSPPPSVAVVTSNSRERRNIQESKVAHLNDDRDTVDMDTSMDPIVTISDGGAFHRALPSLMILMNIAALVRHGLDCW
jgi:hypothetical protein